MDNNKGFTVVEILVVIVILAIVGLMMMLIVIPKVRLNAKESFVNDGKLYLQAATKYFSDLVIENEAITEGCISISDLNKTDVGINNKKSYKGYIIVSITEDGQANYDIAITNQKFYSYDEDNNSYLLSSSKLTSRNILDNFESIKDFPTECLK